MILGIYLWARLHYIVETHMFTGLVETLGKLAARAGAAKGARLTVHCDFRDLALGESIAVDGVCLTVDRILAEGFEADASSETLARTTLGGVPVGGSLNLERALLPTTRLGGHLVSGHVDGVGALASRVADGDYQRLTFRAPGNLLRFIAEKGSITVSGVSLTVNGTEDDTFNVMVIPHTLSRTTLGGLRPNDGVNLEVDLIARYVARLLGKDDDTSNRTTNDADADQKLRALLERKGYV